MNHVLYGASIPFLIALIVYLRRGGRANLPLMILTPLAMAFMATWAVFPDIPRILGFHGLYMRLEADPRIDVFLWHRTLDQLEYSKTWCSSLESDSSWFTLGVTLEAAALMAMAIRELFRKETR